ncbi:cell division protein FtsX [Algihabitans sp.]|uniref:cell division protein FtsX n=1 Tax=Algihabitans sp. TaxID=2821514 RepID=UPI003BAB7B8D
MRLGFLFSRGEVPLARDASARFLPWLIAFMVYLAGLALLAAVAMDAVAARWQGDLVGRLTVQVPPPGDPRDSEARQERLDRVVQALLATPAVSEVEVLSRAQTAALLEPWLGEAAAAPELPAPDLVAVTLRSSGADLGDLPQRLAEVVPGTGVDDHQRWLARLFSLAGSIEALAFLVVALVSVAAVATVIFVTRTGLAIHRQVIELLHVMGARDLYVAEQFQGHALRLGLAGGVGGAVAAALTAVGVRWLLRGEQSVLLPGIELGVWQWLLLAVLPLTTGLVAMLTARWTVLRTLAKLP